MVLVELVENVKRLIKDQNLINILILTLDIDEDSRPDFKNLKNIIDSLN